MIHPNVRPMIWALETAGSKGNLIAICRKACMSENGSWNIPERPKDRQPALFEMCLFNISASGLSPEEMARNWVNLAAQAIAAEDAQYRSLEKQGLGEVMTALTRAAARRNTSLERAAVDMTTLFLTDMHASAPHETDKLIESIGQRASGVAADGLEDIVRSIEIKAREAAGIAA